MADSDTSEWFHFFLKAGILEQSAYTYAIKFSENRMRMDMLPELDKQYLKELEINLLGDVISILRHAKQVIQASKGEKMLPNVTVTSISSESHQKEDRLITSQLSSTTVDNFKSTGEKSGPSFAPSSSSGMEPVKIKPFENKRLASVVFEADSPTEKKKVRRVLPAHEGKYKIIMPKGISPRSRVILAKLGNQKKNVFERLGQGTNEEPTETEFEAQPSRTATVTTMSDKHSVFSRLGNKNESIEPEESKGPPLEYAGILKKCGINKKKIKKNVKSRPGTMRADVEGKFSGPSKVAIAKATAAKKLGCQKQNQPLIKVARVGNRVVVKKPITSRLGKQIVASKKYLKMPTAMNFDEFDEMGLESNVAPVRKLVKVKRIVPSVKIIPKTAKKVVRSSAGITCTVVAANDDDGDDINLETHLDSSDLHSEIPNKFVTGSSNRGLKIVKKSSIKSRLGQTVNQEIRISEATSTVRKICTKQVEADSYLQEPYEEADSSPVKSVSFGTVTEKFFDKDTDNLSTSSEPFCGQKKNIFGRSYQGPGSLTLRTGVFSRLGSN